jgi:hypothetical protein
MLDISMMALFHKVHGLVGSLYQSMSVGAVYRIHGEANARTSRYLYVPDVKGPVEAIFQPQSDFLGAVTAGIGAAP